MATDTATAVGEFVAWTQHTTGPGPTVYLAEVRGYGAELMCGDFEFTWAPLDTWVPLVGRSGWEARVTGLVTYPRHLAGARVELRRKDTPEGEKT